MKKSEWDKFISKYNDNETVTLPLVKDIPVSDKISVPCKMELFEGLDITSKDGLFVTSVGEPQKLSHRPFTDRDIALAVISDKYSIEVDRNVLLVDEEKNVVGLFNICTINLNNVERVNFLSASASRINFCCVHNSAKYYLVFRIASDPAKPIKLCKVPIEVLFRKTDETNACLLINFDMSYATASCFLDSNYVSNVSDNAVRNGNVKLDAENDVLFEDYDVFAEAGLVYHKNIPAVVHIDNCFAPNNISYSFGYKAINKKIGCFMEIKHWTSNININEPIWDSKGNQAKVSRRDIISQFLMYVIETAEKQFKCRFKNVKVSGFHELDDKASPICDDILKKRCYSVISKDNLMTKSEWDKFISEYNNNATVTLPLVRDIPVSDEISVPCKMELFEGLDITYKDRLSVTFSNGMKLDENVLLVNGDDMVVGIFRMRTLLIPQTADANDASNDNKVNYLTADISHLNFCGHSSTKYCFIFLGNNSLYKVPIETSLRKTDDTSTHLCIDFGTSNTTAGCFLDSDYVNNISNIAVLNGNVKPDAENIVLFEDLNRTDGSCGVDMLTYQKIVPTTVYVDDCSDSENISYSFGYDAARRIMEDKYCPKASCFMEIKRWTSNINVNESVWDSNGNKAEVSRRDIISQFLMYVINTAERQVKCRFKNVHISVPVKLKDKVLSVYADILRERGYILEVEHAVDEGVAVLYGIINNQIRDKAYVNGKKEHTLIIDCGGGTSDLASCTYSIKEEDEIIDLDITTEYMNGDINFGGNNLTYRIMQYMKVVYANQIKDGKRLRIDDLISRDVNEIFSYIEGELENDDSVKVEERYRSVYVKLNESYNDAEKVIPTKYKNYENSPSDVYNKVKNNFYFLWKLAEEMKKAFYKTTSVSRCTFCKESVNSEKDIDLHVDRIEEWRLSIIKDGTLTEHDYPDIQFIAKEIDKLLRADIYYLVRKFISKLYMNNELNTYGQIRLSGQSSKIGIFIDSLKEFLPGKKIKSGRGSSEKKDAAELKLLCVRGAIMYLHALEKSGIEITLRNETKNIPISVYIKGENDSKDKIMFRQGDDWQQPAERRRITSAGKEIYLHMRNVDREIGEPYKYVYEDMKYNPITVDELKRLSGGRISQQQTDSLGINKKYIFVFLNKDKWGFDIMPIYRNEEGTLFSGDVEFCSFEMDILQETFFDGRK